MSAERRSRGPASMCAAPASTPPAGRGRGRRCMPSERARAGRAWQRMLSGRRLDLLDPSPLDIEIEDIAHGLAFVARWNGQTHGEHPFSVAEHSLLVEDSVRAARPGAGAALAARGAAARRAGVRDRRHDLAGQGRGRAGLRGDGRAAGGGGAPALRAAGDAAGGGEGARSRRPTGSRPGSRRCGSRASREAEANRLFGAPKLAGVAAMALPLRPPGEVKRDFLARHAALLAAC